MDLLDKIEKKYKKHKQFNEYLKDDIESAKNDLEYFYHFKRLGYHLIHIFKDEKLSRETFEYAIDKLLITYETIAGFSIITDIEYDGESIGKGDYSTTTKEIFLNVNQNNE